MVRGKRLSLLPAIRRIRNGTYNWPHQRRASSGKNQAYDIRHAARPEFSPRHLLALAGEKSRKLHSGRFFFLRPHRREREGIRLLYGRAGRALRSEEHTSELQSLMRISYAVFCLKKKTHINKQ